MALVPEWRGRSVGRKAQEALCGYIFMTTGVNRIKAVTNTRNTAAKRIAVGISRCCQRGFFGGVLGASRH